MDIKEAIEKYYRYRTLNRKGNTVMKDNQELKRFFIYARRQNIEDVTIDDIIGYLHGMLDFGWNPNSLRDKCCTLRKFFVFYRQQGYKVIHEGLIPMPRRIHSLPRIATKEEYSKLLSVIPPDTEDPRHIRNAALIRLYYDTGARNSEIVSLNVEDLDTEHMRTIIKTAKNRGTRPFRQIYWSEETNRYVKRWLVKRAYLIEKKKLNLKEPGILFFALCGGMYGSASGNRLTVNAVGNLMRSYSKKAGIRTLNAHSLRHNAGHEIIHNGGNISDVANILGHANVTSSMIYATMAGEELEGRYRKLRG